MNTPSHAQSFIAAPVSIQRVLILDKYCGNSLFLAFVIPVLRF